MSGLSKSGNRGNFAAIAAFLAFIVALFFVDLSPVPTDDGGTKEKARVLSVDNSDLMQLGLLQTGTQRLKVEVLSGAQRGSVFAAANQLRAQMDLDKVFGVGDTVLVSVWNGADPARDTINAQDFYRLNYTALLFAVFAVLLIAFGGVTGVKALLSFVFACLVIWKIVVPVCLRGANPILASFACVCVITAAIVFLVAGFNRKGATAYLGAILGVGASCLMAVCFADLLHINGSTMPYSQALFYSGYDFLSLSELYIGAVFLAASGAVMDLSVDIAAGQAEVVRLNPGISRTEVVRAGMNIGKTVVGTMATTLLLAYAGGYLTLLMAFNAQGVTPADFINSPYIAAETVRTIVGSIGIVLVAPFTALVGGFIFCRNNGG